MKPGEKGVESELRLDFLRAERTGLPEAIFAEGKSAAQLDAICTQAAEQKKPLLFTRMSEAQVAALSSSHRARLDFDARSRTGIFLDVTPPAGAPVVAVVTAGSTDVPVAREAARTLTFLGVPHVEVYDVGVAGLWRLLEKVELLRSVRAVICVAGMEAALPSVVGGLVPGLVIAVPTSVGYGAAFEGIAALLTMLNSCAPGVAVVNIDNGYGAGHLAAQIAATA